MTASWTSDSGSVTADSSDFTADGGGSPGVGMGWTADSGSVTADSGSFTADGGAGSVVPPTPPLIPPGIAAQLVRTLADMYHFWSGDLAVSSTGDLLIATGLPRSQQRILRRLNTNPGSYIGQPKYGAGLPQFIGTNADAAEIAAVTKGQMLLEDSVAQSPPPIVTVSQVGVNAISESINYVDNPSNAPTVLAFTLGN